MSPASYLTAPPRVAANILAPFEPVATITAVSIWAIYGGLIVGIVAIAPLQTERPCFQGLSSSGGGI